MIQIITAHLVSLHFGHQVLEGGQVAESDHGLALFCGQTLHFGQRRARQDDLLTAQVVLEFCIIRRLAGQEIMTGFISYVPINLSDSLNRSYLVMPFKLILASSIAKVMWSWCSIPRATLLNTT